MWPHTRRRWWNLLEVYSNWRAIVWLKRRNKFAARGDAVVARGHWRDDDEILRERVHDLLKSVST